MKHYVLTRWNLGLYESINRGKCTLNAEDWMKDRMRLFEKYCLPSMMKQTNKDFTWIMGFHKDTPTEILEKYRKISNVKIVFGLAMNYMKGLYGNELKNGDRLLTSRIDNDDAITPNFLQRVREEIEKGWELIDFIGYQYDTRRNQWYHSFPNRYNGPISPFLSFIETIGKDVNDPIKTVNRFQAMEMASHFSARLIKEHLWCQVIHGNNIICKIRGNPINGNPDLSHKFWNYK
jgi:hypothetical protein